MRTILVFSLLSLVLCAGCQKQTPKPDKDNGADPLETLAPNREPPLIEPLVPKVDEPAEVPETPRVPSEVLGKYAAEVVPLPPVEDMTAQIDEYISKIEKELDALDGSPKYAADAAAIVRDANALALLALAVGLAETDSKYKKSASPIIAATKPLAAAKNLDEGKKAFAALKASLTDTGNEKSLAWTDKVSALAPAMKALPNLSSAVKRMTDTERKLMVALDRQPQRVYGQLAALAVISQGTIPNIAETAKPDAAAEWKKLCEEFRDAALKTNAAAHQYAKDKTDGKEPNYAAFDTGFKAMTASCDDCHKVFYPSAVGQN